jgi:hypothetical protein
MPATRSIDVTRPATGLDSDVVMRATAILGLGAVAVIHFSQVVPTTEQTPWLGASFVALTLACIGVAAQLLYRGDRWVWAQVAVLNGLAISGYVFTRVFSTPFDNTDVGNWSEMLGVAALFTEGMLMLLSLHVITGIPAPPASHHQRRAVASAGVVVASTEREVEKISSS